MTTAADQGFDRPSMSPWRTAALAMLSVRVIQGFIYWGGGSRRFIYAPNKLDPDSPVWLANKFQSAMPGALFGTDHLVSFMLLHFWILYPAIILFSAVELIAGLMLITGTLTRLAAFATICLSLALMIIFGWQGSTCVDEWTMAACNLAMGVGVMLMGSSAYAVDNVLQRRYPALAARPWFPYLAGNAMLPVSQKAFHRISLAALGFVLVTVLGTYNYYRGAIFSAYHAGPVSPSRHHYSISDAVLNADGSVTFHIYMDGGTSGTAGHIMLAALLNAENGQVLSRWDTDGLTHLASGDVTNTYDYNQFHAGPFGLAGNVGAKAVVTLPGNASGVSKTGPLRLVLTDVDGRQFSAPVRLAQ